MRKRPSHWPSDRSLFRDRGKRRSVTTWIVLALSVAAAVLLAGLWRNPSL